MLAGVIAGASSYIKALGDIREYRLLPYLLYSALFSLFIGATIIWGIFQIYDDIGSWLAAIWIWDWGKQVVERIAQGVTAITSLLLFFFLFKYLVFILMSPLLSWVSQIIEKRRFGSIQESGQSFVADFIRGFRLSLRNVVREIFLSLLLLIMGVVLPFLSWLIPFALFTVQAYYAGFGNMDYTLERYKSRGASIAYVRQKKGYAIGNGAVFLALLAIPVLGMLLAPFLGAVSASHTLIPQHRADVN